MIPLIFILVVGIALIVLISLPQQKAGSRKRKTGGDHRAGTLDREFVSTKWQVIETMVQGGGSLRDAVSEADKLLDYAMKHSGIQGETMGERLKRASSRFSDINAIWSAHKVRNALAHEAEFDLVPSQAKEAVASFKRGLQDLGAL